MSLMRFVDNTDLTPQGLLIAEVEKPSLNAGEVLIEVHYFGLNRPDVLQRQGLYPAPSNASPILGLEVSGYVVAVADDVTQWRCGDAVCALANGGGYAEYCAVPASQCLPVPKGLTLAEAASLPEAMFTVWSNVFVDGGLAPNEDFLVHAGASGIGSTAIQMATAMGSTVYSTASSDEKCKFCLDLGASLAINYRQHDFVEEIYAATQNRGVDVILDMVGGNYIEKNIAVAATDARIINIAFLQGAKVNLNLLPVMLKRIVLRGSTLRPRTTAYKGRLAEDLLTHIWPLIETGRIKPCVAACLPWQRVGEAHQMMEDNTLLGKAVLEVVR